jgi:exodeoxyribonuclease V gamma subunit
MGSVCAAWQFEPLAHQFSHRLSGLRAASDAFAELWVVAPSRAAKAWLQLFLAREHGICANIRWSYLEEALWAMLARLDRAEHPVSRLTVADLRSMILSVLAGRRDEGPLAPLWAYVGDPDGGRSFHRKANQLADRLAQLFEEYEFHRGEMVAGWLDPAAPASAAPDLGGESAAEARSHPPTNPDLVLDAQRALYVRLMAAGGLRDRIDASTNAGRLTLREYADRILAAAPKPAAGRPPVLLFGLAHVSPLHARLLHALDAFYDLDIYLHTPLAARCGDRRQLLDLTLEAHAEARNDDPLAMWGRAAVRTLRRLTPLLAGDTALSLEIPADADDARPERGCLLRAVQDRALGRAASAEVSAHDGSLRVVACPSPFREAEAVYQDVLHNLQNDPSLCPGDVAVLVPDMDDYRAPLEVAFAADGGRAVPYTLRDVPARDASHYAAGVEQLLELAEGRFPRADVCDLILNPCFVARLGVDRAEAEQWVAWARKLNVCHSFDRAAKAGDGYHDSLAYTWQLAMRRLRFGYLFERSGGDGDGGGALDESFDGVVPFGDIESGDAEAAGRFCEVVERLYRRLAPLRKLAATGATWRDELRRVFDDFLAAPADAPGEAGMRWKVDDALEDVADLDPVRAALGEGGGFGIAMARQHLLDGLASVSGVVGRHQPGGVTVCQLATVRPLSFKLVYVLGLGEGDFPGTADASVLDLLAREPRPTDVSGPDLNRQLFLDAVLCCRRRLWLSYVDRDLQKDRPLYPSSVLSELLRLVREHVAAGGPRFETVRVPLSAADPAYLAGGNGDARRPVNSSPHDRLACLLRLRASGQVNLNGELTRRVAAARPDFHAPAPAAQPAGAGSPAPVPLPLRQVKKFLQNPAEATVQRHLRLFEDEVDPPEDDEPFYSVFPNDWQCKDVVLRRFVADALSRGAADALERLDGEFDRYYAGCERVGSAPEGAYGDIDRERLRTQVRSIVGDQDDDDDGPLRLARFLRERAAGGAAARAAVVGSSPLPAAAAGCVARFPPLDLSLPDGRVARLSGSQAFLFLHEDALEVLAVTTKSDIRPGCVVHHAVEPFLFLTALRAGARPGADGRTSAEWSAGRRLVVHLAHGKGVATYDFGDVEPDTARQYLEGLANEFLGTLTYDLLPLEDVAQVGLVPDLADRLRASLEEGGQSDRGGRGSAELLRLIEPRVPDDAFAVARRRLGPLFDAAARGAAGAAAVTATAAGGGARG